MANPENLLINSVLATRDWRTVQDHGMDRREFHDFKDEWLWLVEYVKRYGELPSRGDFRARFPDFVVPDEDVSDVGRYCVEAIEWDARWRLIRYFDQGLELLQDERVADALALSGLSEVLHVTLGQPG